MRFSVSDFAGRLSEVICIEYKWRCEELMELPVGVYIAVADLENDKILITNERLKKKLDASHKCICRKGYEKGKKRRCKSCEGKCGKT